MTYGPVFVDVSGPTLSETDLKVLQHPMVGGVILFFKNCKTPEQLKNLIKHINETRSLAGLPRLEIAVDREGGNVQRMQTAGFGLPAAADVYGRLYDLNPDGDIFTKFTTGEAQSTAAELKELGFTMNLAPVLDSCSGDLKTENPVIGGLHRSFHPDPEVRTKIASMFIQALKDHGLHSAAKHFPDHGVCTEDSHLKQPVCDLDSDALLKHQILPYQKLIAAGLLDAVMPAHVTYTNVDPENPAGFSTIWLQDILRGQLGFKGVVISDCLSMAGADIGDMRTRAHKSLSAGCDFIIMCNQKPDLVLEVLNHLQATYRPEAERLQRVYSFLGLERPTVQAQPPMTLQYNIQIAQRETQTTATPEELSPRTKNKTLTVL